MEALVAVQTSQPVHTAPASHTSTVQLLAWDQERTTRCQHCAAKNGGYPAYYAYSPHAGHQTVAKPTACPTCGHQRPTSTLDYADTLCMDNAGLTRTQALKAMEVAYTIRSRAATARAAASPNKTVEALLTDVGAGSLPSLRNLTTPLHVACKSCGGSYIFYRNVPNVQHTPPLYCVWCASPRTSVLPSSTEDTAWLTLAHHYSLTTQAIQTLHDYWVKRSHLTTFSAFMSSDLVKGVLA